MLIQLQWLLFEPFRHYMFGSCLPLPPTSLLFTLSAGVCRWNGGFLLSVWGVRCGMLSFLSVGLKLSVFANQTNSGTLHFTY